MRSRDASSISGPLVLVNAGNGLLWTVYGAAVEDALVWAPDLAGVALAAALCDTVDAYGFGAYRGRGGAFAYIHFYDEEPWLGDAKGGELVFAAELRNALFDALGVFRWVWW